MSNPINTKAVYSNKAEKYARYRWDYEPGAIDKFIEIARINNESIVADIGAGTGILTKPLANKAGLVYAIEPNAEFRRILQETMRSFSSALVINGSAEKTGLEGQSVDAVAVAQAIHWFDPEPARYEILRILKSRGWLGLFRNYNTNKAQIEAIGNLMRREYGVIQMRTGNRPQKFPIQFYYGKGVFQRFTFPFQLNQNFDEFFGALTTASYAPDEGHPLFGKFKAKVQEIFSQFSRQGLLLIEGETELIIGQPHCTGL